MTRVTVKSATEWTDVCSTAFVPLSVRSAGAGFRAQLQQLRLGQRAAVTHVVSGASQVSRNAQMIASTPRDDILLSLQGEGQAAVDQHNRRAILTPGTAALYDTSRPYTLTFPGGMSELVLQIPRRELPMPGYVLDALTARTLPASGSLRALRSLASVAASPPAELSGLEREAIADALVSVLRAVVAAERAGLPSTLDSELLLVAVRRHIDEHAHDAHLTPERIAHRHHISLRLLQKLFAREDDSPAAYLRRVRLRAARERLRQGATVGEAATRSGFNDPDSFTRAFKRQYGISPSSIRRDADPADQR